MTRLYFVKSFPVNVTNILHALLIRNSEHPDLPVVTDGPCEYTLDGKFIVDRPHKLVETFGAKSRTIDWAHRIGELREYMDIVSPEIVIFGSYSDEQIRSVKDDLPFEIITIGVNYTSDEYEFLLNNMVEFHCHLNGGDEKELRIAFDQQNLCPRESLEEHDYNINFTDLFVKEKVIDFCERIGLPMTQKASDFYDAWLDLNSPPNSKLSAFL